MFAVLNIMCPNFSQFTDILNFITSFVVMIVMVYLPIYLYKICEKDMLILWQPDYYAFYGFLYCEFKITRKKYKCFISFIVAKQVISGAILSGFHEVSKAQTGLSFLISLLFIIMTLYIKPFIDKITLFFCVGIEFGFCLINLLFLFLEFFGGGLSDEDRYYIDVVISSIATAVIIGVYAIGILSAVRQILYAVKKRGSQKRYDKFIQEKLKDGADICGRIIMKADEETMFNKDDFLMGDKDASIFEKQFLEGGNDEYMTTKEQEFEKKFKNDFLQDNSSDARFRRTDDTGYGLNLSNSKASKNNLFLQGSSLMGKYLTDNNKTTKIPSMNNTKTTKMPSMNNTKNTKIPSMNTNFGSFDDFDYNDPENSKSFKLNTDRSKMSDMTMVKDHDENNMPVASHNWTTQNELTEEQLNAFQEEAEKREAENKHFIAGLDPMEQEFMRAGG